MHSHATFVLSYHIYYNCLDDLVHYTSASHLSFSLFAYPESYLAYLYYDFAIGCDFVPSAVFRNYTNDARFLCQFETLVGFLIHYDDPCA